jgi:hypothetical protein
MNFEGKAANAGIARQAQCDGAIGPLKGQAGHA